jgi:membrane protease YdiL (CAAX protease family)
MTVPVQAKAARRGPARRPGAPARRGAAAGGAALPATLAGLAFLLARPGLEALPPGARVGLLAAGYTALGLGAAVAVRTPAGRTAAAEARARGPQPPPAPATSPRRAGAVLLVGVAAVGGAGLMAGAAPPLPAGALALALSLLAAVAEEALFRGALYGLVERWGPALAVGVSAVLFAMVHVPSYGLSAVPVDLGAGLLFGWQRWATGRWTVPAATHAAANLLAVILR